MSGQADNADGAESGFVRPKPDYITPRIFPCRGCGATIAMWRTPAGKNFPADPDGTSHFATCPQAQRFRDR